MELSPKKIALLRQVDSIMTTHGAENPELLKELVSFRSKLEAECFNRNPAEFVKLGLLLSAWIKFIFDHFPPTD